MSEFRFDVVDQIDPEELRSFYDSQGSCVPEATEKLSAMVDNSVCFVTARDDSGRLIGIARGLADGVRGVLQRPAGPSAWWAVAAGLSLSNLSLDRLRRTGVQSGREAA